MRPARDENDLVDMELLTVGGNNDKIRQLWVVEQTRELAGYGWRRNVVQAQCFSVYHKSISIGVPSVGCKHCIWIIKVPEMVIALRSKWIRVAEKKQVVQSYLLIHSQIVAL